MNFPRSIDKNKRGRTLSPVSLLPEPPAADVPVEAPPPPPPSEPEE